MQLLPELVIRKIIAYLDFYDIVNIRLSCSIFYKYSHCKEFYQGVNISPINLSNRSIPSFASLMSNGGRFLKLNLQNVHSMKSILPYIHNAANVSINVEQLQLVTENCQDLSRIEIQLHADNYLDKVTSFSCLEKLGCLNELHIKGICGKHISCSNTWNVIRSAKTISTICFENMILEDRNKNPKYKDRYMEAFNSMHHIRIWKFINTKIHRDNLFELPTSVASLTIKCRSFNKFYFSQLDNVYFINPAHIQPNLKVVELSDLNLRDVFKRNGLLFSNVEIIKLKGTINNEFFLQKFIPCCKFTLKEVTLDGIFVSESLIDGLLAKCNSLQKLTLRNISGVTKLFLETLKTRPSLSVLIENLFENKIKCTCYYRVHGIDEF